MKKLLTLLLFVAMSTLLVVGCTEDLVIPPPTPPQKTYNFLAVFAGKGDVTPDKVNNLLSGAKVPLNIVAETGYVIASVKVNGVPMEGIPKGATSFNLNVTITSDTQVEVAFISDRLFLRQLCQIRNLGNKFLRSATRQKTILISVLFLFNRRRKTKRSILMYTQR